MKTNIKKLATAVVGVLAAIAINVSAFAADYVFPFNNAQICYIEGVSSKDASETEAVLTGKVDSAQKFITATVILLDERADAEFWNSSDVTVSCEVMLETEGADVYAYMPGFDSGWGWIDPSKSTSLKTGEWITIKESGSHFYKAFSKNGANRVLVQIRGNSADEQEITVRLRNFMVTGGAAQTTTTVATTTTTEATTTTPATTTTEATTTTPAPIESEPVESTPEESEPVESAPEESEPAESTPEESEPVESAPEESKPTESAPEESKPEQTTTVSSATTTTPKIDYSQYNPVKPDASNQTVTLIVVIVVVAVVIAAGVVVGYLIYKKKKFY